MTTRAFISAELADLRMLQESSQLLDSLRPVGVVSKNVQVFTKGNLNASFGYPGTGESEPKTLIVEAWWEGNTMFVGNEERTIAKYSNRFRAVFRVLDFVGFEWPKIPLEAAMPYIVFLQDSVHRRVEQTLTLMGIHGQALKGGNLTVTDLKDAGLPPLKKAPKKIGRKASSTSSSRRG